MRDPTPSLDPIFAAIKAHRDAVDRVNNAPSMSDEAIAPWVDDISETWATFVRTKPTTLNGVLAFVDYGVECAEALIETTDSNVGHALTTLRSALLDILVTANEKAGGPDA